MTPYKNWVVFPLFWTQKGKWLYDWFLEDFFVPYKQAVIIIFFKLWPSLARSHLDIGKNHRTILFSSQFLTHSQSFVPFFQLAMFLLFLLLFSLSTPLPTPSPTTPHQNPGPLSHVLRICSYTEKKLLEKIIVYLPNTFCFLSTHHFTRNIWLPLMITPQVYYLILSAIKSILGNPTTAWRSRCMHCMVNETLNCAKLNFKRRISLIAMYQNFILFFRGIRIRITMFFNRVVNQ